MTEQTTATQLRESLDALIIESRALRVDVGETNKTRKRDRLVNLVMTLLAIITVLMVAAIGYQNNSLSEQIRSCTSPDGRCYQDGLENNRRTLQLIVRSSVLAESCAKTEDGSAEIQACVDRGLGN